MFDIGKELSDLQDDLLSFMRVNRIYTLEKLLNFSDTYLCSLKGYNRQVFDIIDTLRKGDEEVIDKNLLERKQQIKTPSIEEMELSAWLFYIIRKEGYEYNPFDFFMLSNSTLMTFEFFWTLSIE